MDSRIVTSGNDTFWCDPEYSGEVPVMIIEESAIKCHKPEWARFMSSKSCRCQGVAYIQSFSCPDDIF